ncbi:MAG: aminopeptidase, partial [Nanoarchaeota archaeon]
MDKKTKNQEVEEKIMIKRENAWKKIPENEHKDVFKFSEDYKSFMLKNKTERLASENIIAILKKEGFKDINDVSRAHSGEKFYKVIKSKTIIAFIVGKTDDDLRIVGSHLDSPRLDLKPLPISEDSGLALLKTHYYGGIKKYHWVNQVLELHGVVHTKDGKKINISIGAEDNDSKFIIPDLLPHLARKQMEKEPKNVVEGEELNILVGNIPVDDNKIKSQLKLAAMKILNERYSIVEEDLCFAELELVPSVKPVDIGLDRSMIGAYGHDDKVCVYTSLRALLGIKNPEHTAVCLFADKEEIGSVGNTGAESLLLHNFAHDYSELLGGKINPAKLLENSKAISADVTAGVNPNYKDVHDLQNASYLGQGVSVEKYGGSGGKYFSNDTHAEYMNFIRQILDK